MRKFIILLVLLLMVPVIFMSCGKGGQPLTGLSEKELAKECLWVDWREEEEDIINAFGKRLTAPDKMVGIWKGDDLQARYNEQEYKLPLTTSGKDRSVAISSIAEILKDKYEMRLLKASRETDSLAFLLLDKAAWNQLDKNNTAWVQEHFEHVAIGTDLFGKGEPVPYVHR